MKATTLFLSVILGLTLSVTSCSEDVAESQSGTKTLRILVDDETKQAQTRAAYAGLETTFEAGDAIGLYAVDGATARYSNVKFIYDGEQWTAESNIPYNTNYTYYAYYPYTEEPEVPTFTVGIDENTAFADMIDGWEVSDNQGTLDDFRKNDLMLAKGTNGGECTIAFTMLHKMALAVIDDSEAEPVTFSYSTQPETKSTATVVYDGKVPYHYDGKYYFFLKPGETTNIGGQELTAKSGGNYITANGGKVTASYGLSYSTDGGVTFSNSTPSWLRGVIKSDAKGANEPVNFVVTVSDEKTTDKVTKTDNEYAMLVYDYEALKTATPVSDYDLSMHNNDGTTRESRTTANCYLVHAPGTYKLPLVYGNAIKNGQTNELAYKATETGDNIKPNLVRHDDQPISAPWIKNNGITVNGAAVVWQDAKGLVSNVKADGDYLTFTVNKETITAGNAVIAAKAGDVIVWSWHIWVTEETLPESDLVPVTVSGHTYQFTSVNVGWVPVYASGLAFTTAYAGSTCVVKLTFDNGSSRAFTVVQPDYVEKDYSSLKAVGYQPFYQWGRKDALIPAAVKSAGLKADWTNNHDTWDGEGNQLTSSSNNEVYNMITGAKTIGETIQNPISHFYRNYGITTEEPNHGPYNEAKYNYWNINNNSGEAVVGPTQKTVYDPCPPGLCVPTAGFFTSSNNSTGTSDKGAGWQVNGRSLHFPHSGYRVYTTGVLQGVGTTGGIWSASTHLGDLYTDGKYHNYLSRGRGIFFNDTGTIRLGSAFRPSGYPVRAVTE